jgi:hypothetical protein
MLLPFAGGWPRAALRSIDFITGNSAGRGRVEIEAKVKLKYPCPTKSASNMGIF